MAKEDFTKNTKRKSNKELETIAKSVANPKTGKEKTVRFAIRVPESIHTKLEQTAQRLGMTKKAIVMLGLNEQLEKFNK